jgi:hypothetical protein
MLAWLSLLGGNPGAFAIFVYALTRLGALSRTQLAAKPEIICHYTNKNESG